MGITVLPPDVNESLVEFAVVEGQIRFGLAAVKGVGEGAVDAILAARDARRTLRRPLRSRAARRDACREPQGLRGADQVRRARHAPRQPRATARSARRRARSRRRARPATASSGKLRSSGAIEESDAGARADAPRGPGAVDDGRAAVGEGDARDLRLRSSARRRRGRTRADRSDVGARSAFGRGRGAGEKSRGWSRLGAPHDDQGAAADADRHDRGHDRDDRVHRLPEALSRFAGHLRRGRDRHRQRPAAAARTARRRPRRRGPARIQRLGERGAEIRPRVGAARTAGLARDGRLARPRRPARAAPGGVAGDGPARVPHRR